MMQKTRAFAEFETFYGLFRPLTPYGRARREKRTLFTSAAELKAEYDLTAAAAAFLGSAPHKADKFRFHLRNIPAPDLSPEALAAPAGLFLARKFLSNVRAAFALLPAAARAKFGAAWRSDGLLALLDKGGGGEAFHIADAYEPELADVRAGIAGRDRELARLREACHKLLRERRGLDFSDRDFLVIDERTASGFSGAPEVFAEPFDGSRVTVKPVYGRDYMEAAAARDRLRAREQELETAVCRRLAAAVSAERAAMELYAGAVESLDVAFEKARLAAELKLERPLLRREPGAIRLTKARFLPLENRLKAAGLKYTPLTAVFTRRVNVLYGSNMGGKTVALKTLAFAQLLAQSGFFVPAASFETCVFATVAFIGGGELETAGGLSSFGLEMNDFAEAHAGLKSGSALLLMDEFARTTNSEEAAALLNAMLGDLAARDNACAFLATHFSGIDVKGAGRFKMRGFDTAAFNEYFSGKPACGLEEKLRMINRFMRYELAEGGSGDEARDAIKIAGILGVSRAIIRRAQELMEGK